LDLTGTTVLRPDLWNFNKIIENKKWEGKSSDGRYVNMKLAFINAQVTEEMAFQCTYL
jgi:hypothetical protein